MGHAKTLIGRLAIAMVLGLTALTSAHAITVVGKWDPSFGSAFPELGWRGEATFFVPDACLGESGWVLNSDSCSPFGMKIISAEVEFYKLSDPTNSAFQETLMFSTPSSAVVSMELNGGLLEGVYGTFLYSRPSTLPLAGGGFSEFVLFNLWDQNIGTEVQLITAKNNVDNVESQMKASDEQIKIAKEQLNYTSIYSDVNGVAEDVNIRVGETFAGIAGTSPQRKIVNTSDLKVTTEVPENYLGKVAVGTKVKVNLPDINRTLDAKISVAGKLIDLTNRSFFAEARIPSDAASHPNQVALVQIQDYTKPQSITAPVNTIQSDDKGKYVNGGC